MFKSKILVLINVLSCIVLSVIHSIKVSVKYNGPIEAPIKKDEKVAILKVVYDDELVGEYDLLASKEVKKVNFVSRLLKSLNYLIWGDV